MIKTNSHGGIEDLSKVAVERAKHADLITFPKNISAVNCFNCQWIKDKMNNRGYCFNKHIEQYVSKHMCCNLWNNSGTLRSWEHK